jgi:hypothetical protein
VPSFPQFADEISYGGAAGLSLSSPTSSPNRFRQLLSGRPVLSFVLSTGHGEFSCGSQKQQLFGTWWPSGPLYCCLTDSRDCGNVRSHYLGHLHIARKDASCQVII